jgi:4-amino-4-deoxy-L-arabinose transferase-like glycosyltransferase
MLSTFFFTLTLFLFYRGYTVPKKRSRSYLLMYIPIGLGILNMGPVDLIMPALIISLYLLFMRDFKHLRQLRIGWGILIILIITVPWYLTVSLKGEYVFDILIRTNFIRYFDTWAHERPFYYYLVTIPADFLPWSFFLPGAFAVACSARLKGERHKLFFIIIWFISLFLFFSLSECKRPQYILPLYPALALMVACLWDKAIQYWDDRFFQKWIIIPSCVFFSFLCLGAIGVPIYAWIYQKIWFSTALGTGIIFALFAGLLSIALKRKNPVFIFCLPVLLMLVFTVYGVHFVIPKIEVYKSPRAFCQQITDKLEHGGQWAMYKFFRSAYVYYTHSFCTVLKTEEELKSFLNQKRLSLVVIKEQDYQRIKDSLLNNSHILYRDQIGHRSMFLISNQHLNR